MKHTPGPWSISKHATPEHSPQFGIYAESGSNRDHAIVTGENSNANAKLIAAAPELLTELRRLTEKVERANAIQHSGGAIEPEDWSELYQLTNEARAAIDYATA